MRNFKLYSVIAMLMVLIVTVASCNGGDRNVQTSPDPYTDVSPSGEATAEPTEEAPEPTVEPVVEPVPYVSDCTDYSALLNTLLSGGSFEDKPLTLKGGGVFFGLSEHENKLIAYTEAKRLYEQSHYELSNPVASFPYELGVNARKSIADYIRRNLDPTFAGDYTMQLFGYYWQGLCDIYRRTLPRLSGLCYIQN